MIQVQEQMELAAVPIGTPLIVVTYLLLAAIGVMMVRKGILV